MVVVPPPTIDAALRLPITRRLVVTASGYYPEAENHARTRERGIDENIVIVCVSGSGWAQIGDEHLRVGASSALVIPAGVPHRYGSSKESAWTIWWCHVRGTDAPELIEAVVSSRGNGFAIRDAERVVPFAQSILAELERDTSPARLVSAAGAAWNLLTHVATDAILRERGEPVERAIAYLRDTLETAVRVPELASLVGVSPSHLSALFKRATGGGVLAYQTGLRIARARHLLDTTSLSVTEVAAELGYSDPLYFSRLFRRTQGQSPRDYRQRPRGEASTTG
ncbi:AraC family transcriptional regulator [Frondihabitans sp. PAMC 28766]|nr:AraC family transcriptional regulator [Frondihabitans sp. PAMC 28766]